MPGHKTDFADDLALLANAARAAGDIAKRYFGKAPKAWEKPDAAGPVTEADLAIDQMLRSELLAARPNYGWLSEETEDDTARLSRDRCFIIDPIDGTRAFIAGEASFSHSLAIVEQGRPVAGVVYLPIKDHMFSALAGRDAQMNGTVIRSSNAQETAATVLSSKPNLRPDHWPGGVPPVMRGYRPSVAYRLALVGQGRFDGMIAMRPSWEWDIAAGALIVSQAGGRITDANGTPPRFNTTPIPQMQGVIAAGPVLHKQLMARRSKPSDN